MFSKFAPSLLASLGIFYFLSGQAQNLPIRTLNTSRTFPEIESKAEWLNRSREIQEQILVSCGLWPMPPKAPLKEHIFGKIIRDGYSIEKVYFQTYPGFYLAGNLYRPLNKGRGPFPAILNPHGHWANGRMADTKDGSIAARCINFAQQGMIAFSYDMVGYNDTFFPSENSSTNINFYTRHRQFATNESNLLWNISLMGLQTWNSIRALDFLESLPDVDKSRLACTGESGGGTQTFMLGAIDSRLAAQAPVVMVSHIMQGGCSCENVSGLRIEHSNMEIAAAAAPRPQLIVSATGDWTKDTLKVEGPSIANIYRLLGAEKKLRYVQFDFPHNYNQTSREAVYRTFGEWLHPVASATNEISYAKEPDEDLRVFQNGELPEDAATETELISSLKKNSITKMESLQPKNKKTLEKYKEVFTPAWRHTMQLTGSARTPLVEVIHLEYNHQIKPGAEIKKEERTSIIFVPAKSFPGIIILAHPNGKSVYIDEKGNPLGLAKLLTARGLKTLILDFPKAPDQNQADLFFTTYNRTFAQERVGDLVSACRWAKKFGHKVFLCGTGRAGLWALLAAPAADAVIADCDELDVSLDASLLKSDLFIPGLRKLGAFESVATLASPHPILLHHTGEDFPTRKLANIYSALKKSENFRVDLNLLDDRKIVDQLLRWY